MSYGRRAKTNDAGNKGQAKEQRMHSNIVNVAHNTERLMQSLDCDEDKKKISDARTALEAEVILFKGMKWEHLFAIKEDKRHELTTEQQKIVELYAKLKRALLEVYRDLFNALKEI